MQQVASVGRMLGEQAPLTRNVHTADELVESNLLELGECKIRSFADGAAATAKPRRNPMAQRFTGMRFTDPEESVLAKITLEKHGHGPATSRVLRAGPTEQIYWDPKKVKAAIVTCGGLCPGLNSIIREIYMTLYNCYGARDRGSVLGIRNGYNGFDFHKFPPLVLTPQVVESIHMKGGSILGAGRGGYRPDFIIDVLVREGINHLYVVGGDGTQWAADVLFQIVREQHLPISIIGVPKTIDNDIMFFDRSFGFTTAVDAAVEAIRSAWVEASSCHNGVGIVKLMGRDSGFVARNAALSASLADAVLIPEVEFDMGSLCTHIERRLERKGHAVIVVAEGAGQAHCSTKGEDDTGHTKYGNIGECLKDRINAYLKETVGGRTFYIDPSYIIRSVPATPNDNLFCSRMAIESVHVAMRGYSGVCIGAIHGYMTVLPMRAIASGTRRVNVHSSLWQRVIESTSMPIALTGQNAPKVGNVKKTRGNPGMFRKKKKAAKL
eukprot:TRINITY_DN947_c0_g1_i1.p1 TRINITY_DN947_c0_g1~~TRINITY_DN947_c0_g1_i1.p1  ORF type:complete len:511 (+),score=164.75 TRINITY_DN947_c0_g1_i1:51-1535(+)